MKRFNVIISLLIVIASAVLCGMFIVHSFSNQRDKTDRAVLNHVRYGLFNVGEWKEQISVILAGEINALYLKKTTERELRKRLEDLLNTLIDKIYERIREGNLKSTGGRFKQSFIDMFINLEDVKKGIPEYADALMHELTRAKTKKKVKAALNEQLERYFRETFEEEETSQLDAILARIGTTDVVSARVRLDKDISTRQVLIRNEAVLLAILPILLFSWTALGRHTMSPARYLLLILSLVILLAAGVTTPMIDMEAKISRMGFVLLGHPIQFENQVLYFQSKSILDVFWILITDRDLQMKFVGMLLITFSILFPLLKLASLPAYYYDYRGARRRPVIEFFAVKSGKWSMADVMVIAIFMAYIGFNGIITSQFKQLSAASRELELMTTNGTSLQPGYYLFLTYILLAMIFSGVLAGETRERSAKSLPDRL
jgi:hypothetical protein